MNEQDFIEKREDIWQELSDACNIAAAKGIKTLSSDQIKNFGNLYKIVVADLSYARSQNANDNLIFYLNELAGRAHGILFSAHKSDNGGIIKFIFKDYPKIFRSTYKYTLTATLIFFICWAIGVSVYKSQPQSAAKAFPGNLTNQKSLLEKIPNPSEMSSNIMTNNIRVGILAFALGITAGILTVFLIANNGYVIGVLSTMAIPKMGAVFFWSLILPHGVIELPAIFICGGAGLMIGSAMIAPGNLKRTDAIRLAYTTALKLFAGTIPMFVIAAIVEGFITPAAIPNWLKLAIAALNTLLMIFYLGFTGRKTDTIPNTVFPQKEISGTN